MIKKINVIDNASTNVTKTISTNVLSTVLINYDNEKATHEKYNHPYLYYI